MRKIVIVLMMLSWMVAIDADQISSVGFKNNKNLHELLRFRLPDWGYSAWRFNLSGNGSISDQSQKNDISQLKRDISAKYNYFSLSPEYLYYRESDDRVFNAAISLRAYLNFTKYKMEDNGIPTQDRKQTSQTYYIYTSAEYSNYIHDKHYLNLYLYARNSYSDSEEKESGKTINKDFGYDLYYRTKLGYGFGKLRNVTPLIRALRFAERFQALGYDHSFSSDEIQYMASHLAKYSGYQTVYFRGDKYFWDDLFKGIPAISQLKPFDYFYLANVLEESILNRYEGWKLEAGMSYDQSKVSDLYNDREAGVYLVGIWSKNLDLDHQLRFDLNGVYNFFNKTKDDDTYDIKNSMDFSIEGQYLWAVSDRIQWVNGLYFFYQQIKTNTPEEGDMTEKYLVTGPSSALSYYIENRMSVSVEVNYEYSHREQNHFTRNKHNLSYILSFRYYFSHL